MPHDRLPPYHGALVLTVRSSKGDAGFMGYADHVFVTIQKQQRRTQRLMVGLIDQH